MAEWGGARTPSNPAPVSGPGQLSRRTDGGPQQVQAQMTGMDYGQNQDFQEIQASAPMAAAAPIPRSRVGKAATGQTPVTPLFSPTQRPDEPVTAGVPFGPGAGPDQAAAAFQPPKPTLSDTLRKISQTTNDPQIQSLLRIAERRNW